MAIGSTMTRLIKANILDIELKKASCSARYIGIPNALSGYNTDFYDCYGFRAQRSDLICERITEERDFI